MDIFNWSLIEAQWRTYASVNQISLVQIMACRLVGAKTLFQSMLKYCYLHLRNYFQWNIKQSWHTFIQENAFENVIRDMAAICLDLDVLIFFVFVSYIWEIRMYWHVMHFNGTNRTCSVGYNKPGSSKLRPYWSYIANVMLVLWSSGATENGIIRYARPSLKKG